MIISTNPILQTDIYNLFIVLYYDARVKPVYSSKAIKLTNLVYGNVAYIWYGNNISQIQGMFLRIIWYFVAAIMLICIMSITPKCELKYTYIGSRTLAIYVMHRVIREFWDKLDIYHMLTSNHLEMLLICVLASVFIIYICSWNKMCDFFNSFLG